MTATAAGRDLQAEVLAVLRNLSDGGREGGPIDLDTPIAEFATDSLAIVVALAELDDRRIAIDDTTSFCGTTTIGDLFASIRPARPAATSPLRAVTVEDDDV